MSQLTEAESVITWQDVIDTALTEAEELEEYSVSLQKRIIDNATREVPFSKYGDWTKEMRSLLAAHHAVRRKTMPAGEGTLSSSSIGGVSSSNTMAVNNPTAKESLFETIYGRDYYQYKKNLRTPLYVG